MSDAVGDHEQAAAAKGALSDQIPVGRVCRPEEIVAAVLFLASDAVSFGNGVKLFVYGCAQVSHQGEQRAGTPGRTARPVDCRALMRKQGNSD